FGSFSAGIPATDLAIFAGNEINIDPNNAGYVYVSGTNGNLYQDRNTGTFTGIQNFGAGTGTGALDVAPGNANNVVVTVHDAARDKVFVSTNAVSVAPSMVTFTEITGNLPARPVTQLAFDPNDSTVIYATLSGFNFQTPGNPGHVFRTTISSTTW